MFLWSGFLPLLCLISNILPPISTAICPVLYHFNEHHFQSLHSSVFSFHLRVPLGKWFGAQGYTTAEAMHGTHYRDGTSERDGGAFVFPAFHTSAHFTPNGAQNNSVFARLWDLLSGTGNKAPQRRFLVTLAHVGDMLSRLYNIDDIMMGRVCVTQCVVCEAESLFVLYTAVYKH